MRDEGEMGEERLSGLFLLPFLRSMTRPLKRALVADNVAF